MDAPDVPRIRTLKPEHKVHRKVGRLDDRTYRLWVGLITEADDEGRFVADAEQLRALIFPYHHVVAARVETTLQGLASVGLVTLYQVNGTRYGCFPDWLEHQKVSHPFPSKLPACSEDSRIFQNAPDLARARGSDQGSRIKDQGVEAPPAPDARTAWKIPESIGTALSRTPVLASAQRLHDPAFWRAEIRAHPQIDYAAELLKAEAWITANPSKAPKKDYPRFLHTWFERTAERMAP